MKSHLLISLISLFSFTSLAQDTLIMVDQQQVIGYILKSDPMYFYVNTHNPKGETNLRLEKTQIQVIRYAAGYKKIINNGDLRASHPFGISSGFSAYIAGHGSLTIQTDYFLIPQLNMELSLGVPQSHFTLNVYPVSTAKANRRVFPHIGFGFGLDYYEVESDFIIVPIGVKMIYPNGLQLGLRSESIIYSRDVMILNGNYNQGLQFSIGYRF